MVQAPTKFEPVINIKRSGYLKKLVALAEEVIDRRGHGAALSADILHRAAARVDGTYGDGCWLGRDTGCRLLAHSRLAQIGAGLPLSGGMCCKTRRRVAGPQ